MAVYFVGRHDALHTYFYFASTIPRDQEVVIDDEWSMFIVRVCSSYNLNQLIFPQNHLQCTFKLWKYCPCRPTTLYT
jgi:hypothetical protein